MLMIRGEQDGNSTNEDLLDFYTQLPNGDRQFVILPQHRAQPGLQQQPAPALVRGEELPGVAGCRSRRDSFRGPKERHMKIVQGDELEWVRGLEYAAARSTTAT